MSYPPNMPYRPTDVPYHQPHINPYYNGPPTTALEIMMRLKIREKMMKSCSEES
jgi:hypothetical protein